MRFPRVLSLVFFVIFSVVVSGCSVLDSKTKAGLQVITADVPSSLFLDGQYVDKTPYIGKEFKPGSYTLLIQPDDQKLTPYETQVTLNKGLLTVVTWKPGPSPEQSGGVVYEMEKITNKKGTELSLVSIPDGAIVALPDREKVFTPTSITDIPAGQVDIEFSLPSYDSQKHTINVLAGYKLRITVKLAKSQQININTVTPTATSSATTVPATNSAVASRAAQLQAVSSSSASTATSVKIKPTNYFVNNKEVLRVRETASPAAKEIGTVDVGQDYPFLKVTENGFYKIQLGTNQGWISTQYSQLQP